MKKCFLVFFLLAQLVFVGAQSQEKIMILSLNYSDNSMSFENAFLQEGVFASSLDSGSVSGTIYSSTDEKLFSFKFDIENQIVVEDVGVIEEKNSKQTLILPYFENATSIVFFNEKTNQTLVVPIGFLANLCGNGTCDASESFGNCSQDCKSGGADNYCDRQDDKKCDADCKPDWLDKDCKPELFAGQKTPQELDQIARQANQEIWAQNSAASQPDFFLLVVFGIIAALVVVGAVFLTKKKKSKPVQ